jgi:hypothetical protein
VPRRFVSAADAQAEDDNLSRSLSVLLPVHNAQATLGGHVAGMLEELSELGRQFDVLILDDGSTDATPEVAHDLARRFPQVRLLRSARRRGVEAALEHGLSQTRSHVVVGHIGTTKINPSEIARIVSSAATTSSEPRPAGSFRLLRHDPPQSTPQRAEQRASNADKIATIPIRPNFLARLKDFAFGR